MLRRLVPWTVLASIALTIDAGAAHADGNVGLSLDGHSWASELRQPLFDPAFRWVLGDTETRSFWVRNQGPTAASMRIALRTTDPDRLVAREDLRIDARVWGGSWTSLAGGADQALTDEAIPEGDRVRLDLRVVFVPGATNPTEREHLPSGFVVRLTQAGLGGADGGGERPSGGLPNTGNEVELWLVWLGTALLGGGLVLVLAARRREASDE